jgi:hypothetical protein
MAFYTFHQNNSGGFFKEPARSVVIEAATAEEAITIAEGEGLYFDGYGDCSCCGNRWSSYQPEGDEVPSEYGEPIPLDGGHTRSDLASWDKVPSYLIVYKDGSRKVLK